MGLFRLAFYIALGTCLVLLSLLLCFMYAAVKFGNILFGVLGHMIIR